MSLPSISRIILFTCAINCLLAIDGAEAITRKKFKFCKLDYLLECFNEPTAYFTSQPNGTGIAVDEQEMEQYCFNNHDYLPYCAKKWLTRCGSGLHIDIAERFVLKPFQESLRQFCDSKGTIRPVFLKHAQCLISEVKLLPTYRSRCIRDIQANSEFIHQMHLKSPNLTSFIAANCCAYNQWESCIVNFLRQKCGNEATLSIPFLIHQTSMQLLKGICPMGRYDPADATKCPPSSFQAPPEYVPQGYASNSLISHTFSALCPNVGYGIPQNVI